MDRPTFFNPLARVPAQNGALDTRNWRATVCSISMFILPVTTPRQIAQVRSLFEEYARFLGIDLCFQNFADELADLPGCYAPPRGRLLLAVIDDQPAGCVALRPLQENICEMKRLFVPPAFRSQGIGRKLAEHIVAEARQIGYAAMKLDTLPRLKPATDLYTKLGFSPCQPYYDTPLKETLFMELPLR
jgi:GNAT superfamily N-acetyltransferase